uniref:FHA domain-containing protein n=1 Tax=Nocardia donostiensis TaxID=1538463 RepID=UPI00111C7614|nr:FHA domain-containing protein [Nocardia donostiensis]
MDALAMVAGLPLVVRDLVIGHWPRTDSEGMRACGDAYLKACTELNAQADDYEAESAVAEGSVSGRTRDGMSERNGKIVAALRAKAALCESLGRQCHDTADMTIQTQHLLIMTGVVLAAQLAYDAALFIYGGGFKALADRLAAEQTMRMAVSRFAVGVADNVATGAARRAALHGAIHAGKIGALSGGAISVGAQVWDIQSGVRDEFDVAAFLEMVLGGTVGGVVGAEVGRRLAPRLFGRFLGSGPTSRAGLVGSHLGRTMLLGGAGGLAGGVAGAVPSLIIHGDEIQSLGDIFRMVRESAVTGFAGGFVGAAGSGLRVHSPGWSSMPRNELSASVARQGRFSTRVEELLRSEPPPVVEPVPEAFPVAGGGRERVIERLTFHDGTQLLRETVPTKNEAYERFFTALIADAVGARSPAVHLAGDQIYTQVIPGESGAEVFLREPGAGQRLAATPSGTRLGILDVLTGVGGRSPDEWVLDGSGQVWNVSPGHLAAPTDGRQSSVFARQFAERDASGEIKWKDHSLPRSEIAEIRARVEQLRPIYEAAGYRDVHDAMRHRLDELEQHAPETSGPERVTAPRVAPPPDVDVSTFDDGGATPAGHTGDTGDSPSQVVADPVPVQPGAHEGSNQRSPVRLEFGEGPPVRVDPDRPVVLGTAETSPFVSQLRGRSGIAEEHAVVGLDESGRVWIRDDGGGDGVWVNEEKLARNQAWVLADGDEVALGPDFVAETKTVSVDDSRLPPAGLSFGPDEPPISLAPGEQVLVDIGTAELRSSGTLPQAIVGRDFDGRVWVRDPASDTDGAPRVEVGDEAVGGDKRYVDPGETVKLGDRTGRLDVEFFRDQTLVRVYEDANQLGIRPGEEASFGLSRAIQVDAYGRVWVVDRGSDDTHVNGERLAMGERRLLHPGDTLQYGPVRHSIDFLPVYAVGDVKPVQVMLGSGAHSAPVRLDPGRAVEIGTDARSPFSSQLRHSSGVGDQHAAMVLDHDGRVRIRDTGEPAGVWVNGERIPTGRWVTLTEGAEVSLGPDFVAAVRTAAHPDTTSPAAHFGFESRPKVTLEPGQQTLVDIRNGFSRMVGEPMRAVLVGRDFDGRIWVRSSDSEGSPRIEVDGRPIPPGEKRYVGPDAMVSFDHHVGKLEVYGEGRPVQLRLSDDQDMPPLTLQRGAVVKLGSDPDSPLASEFASAGAPGHHATIYRDMNGLLWLRDENTGAGTWVNGNKMEPGKTAMMLPDDRLRMGGWLGAAQFSTGYSHQPYEVGVKLTGAYGDQPLRIASGEPVVLGSGRDAVLPPELANSAMRDLLSEQHAVLGAYPSGRLWVTPHEAAEAPTYVNGREIAPGEKTPLYSGDSIGLGADTEFTVAYQSPEGGPLVELVDRTPETLKALQHLAAVPEHIYVRVAEFLNDQGGGIVIGNKPVWALRGLEETEFHPNDNRVKWKWVSGEYVPAEGRLYVDAGRAFGDRAHGDLVWHEFGHAADDAYGWRSEEDDWQQLHAQVIGTLQTAPDWNNHYNSPVELFAAAFSAWVGGPGRLLAFANGNVGAAAKLNAFFDGAFL